MRLTINNRVTFNRAALVKSLGVAAFKPRDRESCVSIVLRHLFYLNLAITPAEGLFFAPCAAMPALLQHVDTQRPQLLGARWQTAKALRRAVLLQASSYSGYTASHSDALKG
jgi:hypothetical protein